MTSQGRAGSKERLIASAVDLLRKQGYAASGVSEIARNGQAPMGSFYHHFPRGKEQLCAAAMEAGAEDYERLIERALRQPGTLADQLAAIATLTARALERSEFELGCPVAATALEAVATSPVLRATAAKTFAVWQDRVRRHCVKAGLDDDRARYLASAVIALVEGAEMLARVQRDPRPLEHAARAVAELAAAPTPTTSG